MPPFRLLPLLLLTACGAAALAPAASEHNTAGARLLAIGELDDAEARFRLALEYAPDFAEARNNLGLVAYRRGDLQAAEDRFRSALRLDPDFDEAHSNLGLVLRDRGDRAGAEAAFEAALAIDPGMTHARRNLAELWMDDGDYRGARAHLMRLVQILGEDSPAGAQVAALLAYCELRLGRQREALFRAETALALQPRAPLARLVRGAARALAGDFDGALVDYRVAHDEPRLRPQLAVRMAAVQLARGDVSEARAAIENLRIERGEDPAVQLLVDHLQRVDHGSEGANAD
ncbi:MAG: tetratricopeptide repeat protein [Myxococcota bacterium]